MGSKYKSFHKMSFTRRFSAFIAKLILLGTSARFKQIQSIRINNQRNNGGIKSPGVLPECSLRDTGKIRGGDKLGTEAQPIMRTRLTFKNFYEFIKRIPIKLCKHVVDHSQKKNRERETSGLHVKNIINTCADHTEDINNIFIPANNCPMRITNRIDSREQNPCLSMPIKLQKQICAICLTLRNIIYCASLNFTRSRHKLFAFFGDHKNHHLPALLKSPDGSCTAWHILSFDFDNYLARALPVNSCRIGPNLLH